MTRKDYEAIAAAIKEVVDSNRWFKGNLSGTQDTAKAVANVMAADNPRFDRARFLKACGVQS